jgi:AcrR family transcriptional regulator
MAADPSRSQRAPTAKRTRMTPEARRAQIVESARQVFIESGLSKSRIRDIADKAGVTQALIYYHFKTKAEIYQAAVRDPLDAMVDRLVDETQALASREGVEQAELVIRIQEMLLASMLEIGPLLAVALFADLSAGGVFYSEYVRPKFSEAIASVMVVIGWEGQDEELELRVQRAFGIYFGLSLWRLLEQTDYDVPRIARQLNTILLGGLPAASGRQ